MIPQFFTLRSENSLLVPYEKAWNFQKELVEKRARDEIPDTFLFVEHPSVVTRGRGLQWKPERAERSTPFAVIPRGMDYFEIERGGDLTWHGPGQLVIYPIVKLDGKGFGPNHDIGAFLRKLEAAVERWLATYELIRVVKENASGIWVHAGGGASSLLHGATAVMKIASIGIAIRKWVTYHGIGINLANALEPYKDFSPCGFASDVMTTLACESSEFRLREWNEASRSQIEKELAMEFFSESGVVPEVRIFSL